MSFLSASAVPQNSWSSLGQLFFRRVSELGCRTFLKIPGYFQDPEATRETFDPDGWFRTGDLARIDNGGSLYLIGRKRIFLIALTVRISIPGRSKRCWKMTHSFGSRFYWVTIDHLLLL